MEFETERVARGLDGGGDEDGNTICQRRGHVSATREGLGVATEKQWNIIVQTGGGTRSEPVRHVIRYWLIWCRGWSRKAKEGRGHSVIGKTFSVKCADCF